MTKLMFRAMEPAQAEKTPVSTVLAEDDGSGMIAGHQPISYLLEIEAAERHLEEVGFTILRSEQYLRQEYVTYTGGVRMVVVEPGVRQQIARKATTALEAERLLLDSGYLTRK